VVEAPYADTNGVLRKNKGRHRLCRVKWAVVAVGMLAIQAPRTAAPSGPLLPGASPSGVSVRPTPIPDGRWSWAVSEAAPVRPRGTPSSPAHWPAAPSHASPPALPAAPPASTARADAATPAVLARDNPAPGPPPPTRTTRQSAPQHGSPQDPRHSTAPPQKTSRAHAPNRPPPPPAARLLPDRPHTRGYAKSPQSPPEIPADQSTATTRRVRCVPVHRASGRVPVFHPPGRNRPPSNFPNLVASRRKGQAKVGVGGLHQPAGALKTRPCTGREHQTVRRTSGRLRDGDSPPSASVRRVAKR
jgi:hypothetical protein